jgi:hypothetical protein
VSTHTDEDEQDAVWLARQMSEDDELTGVPQQEQEEPQPEQPEPVDLDDDDHDTESADEQAAKPVSPRAKFIGLAAAGAAVVLAASALFYTGGCEPGRTTVSREVADPIATGKPAAPSGPATPSPQTDRPLPYTADASGSCPAGSTSAQTMDGADPRNAFVCARGGLDGQVISIELPKTFVVTAIVLTPGWVGKDASGTEQWPQHRVVSTVQYTFNDSDGTLITQETQNVHGEATIAVKRVMASRMTMLIRQTARPPAQPPSTAPTPAGGLDSILGDRAPSVAPLPQVPIFGQSATDTDPADATFAISRLKIIGHEAI